MKTIIGERRITLLFCRFLYCTIHVAVFFFNPVSWKCTKKIIQFYVGSKIAYSDFFKAHNAWIHILIRTDMRFLKIGYNVLQYFFVLHSSQYRLLNFYLEDITDIYYFLTTHTGLWDVFFVCITVKTKENRRPGRQDYTHYFLKNQIIPETQTFCCVDSEKLPYK